MKTVIKTIVLSKLRKLELPQFAKRVIVIAEKHDPESLKLTDTFEILNGLKPQLILLEDKYRAHPLTKELTVAHADRLKYAGLISAQMRVHIKADEQTLRAHVKLVRPEVERSLDFLNKDNHETASERVSQFFHRLDKDESLEDACTALSIAGYLDNLRAANSVFSELWFVRNASITSRPNTKTPPIVKEVNAALRNFFNQLILSQARYAELDYSSIIDELNGAVALTEGKIKTRLANNKKRADAALEDKEGDETTIVTESTSEMPMAPTRFTASTNGITPDNVALEIEGAKNGSFEPLKEQRTAAVSTKTTKPSINSTEG